MRLVDRARRRAMLAVLVAIAVGGYLIGHNALTHHSHAEPVRSAIVGNVVVEYPSAWRRAANPATLGLPLAEAVVFAPGGRADASGLLVGSLPAGEASPLPRSLLRTLAAPPQTTVVNLLETQAYRYSGVRVPTFTGPLTIYAIPTPDGRATIAACYAQRGADAFLRRCGDVVAGLTQLGQAQSYDLAPEPAYARRLAAAIDEVDLRRRQIAGTLGRAATSGEVQRLSGELAARFSRAAAALSALEPAAQVRGASSELARALAGAASAYAALATAERGEIAGEIHFARARVHAAEVAVNEGLEAFSLLGYGPAVAG